ncbi:MAG: plasmid maintenance system antidote protein VapI [Candidatus Latescibacterota bacterium]|jgi:plasmid maintenance system antidote protein VapI
MVNSEDFTKRLEKILSHYSLTATAFSEEINFNRSTISHLLSGRNKPSLEFVMKVVKHFPEVELYWLLNGKGSFPIAEEISNTGISEVKKEDATTLPEGTEQKLPAALAKNAATDEIERVIIFYKDGSFKEYRS